MNRFAVASCVMVLLGGLCTAGAQVTTTNSSTVNSDIPDANLTGLASSQMLSFDPGSTITDIHVTLQINGGYNGDLFGYLYHDGHYAVLLNRIGRENGVPAGQSGPGMNITLADGAPDIHLASGNTFLSGTWSPDGRTTFPSLTLDTDTRFTTLGGAFNGTDPNGTWTLFLADVDFGETSSLGIWTLEITTVPEPTTLALMGMGLVVGAAAYARRRKC